MWVPSWVSRFRAGQSPTMYKTTSKAGTRNRRAAMSDSAALSDGELRDMRPARSKREATSVAAIQQSCGVSS